MTADKVYNVAELTRWIKTALERSVGAVWVEGEISNLRRPSSGHCYFTLKDEAAQLPAVLFRGAQRGMRFRPEDGLQVRCRGEVTVYEPQGRLQIIVQRMEESGKGALQARFEALKAALLKEGLFDEARKRTLPRLPQHVGVVTSATGAALRDILNVAGRRFPNLHILVAPVRVQGDGAAAEIAAAIDVLNARGGLDVLIVGRGGGSLEDLWPFNEECVARAIARSRLPVISAVGHEIDFTISDFVADLRAPTPSAAAELLIGRKEDFENLLQDRERRLNRACLDWLAQCRHRLARARDSYVFREPAHGVRQFAQRLDSAEERMRRELLQSCRETDRTLKDATLRLRHGMDMHRQRAQERLCRIEGQMRMLNPWSVLQRGYSIAWRADGRVVTDSGQVRAGDVLHVRLAQGALDATVDVVQGSGGGEG